ncbi:hypothetical protein EDB19DRAFT_1907629 [Suillus lakei]|nr:hypothetical protein EDB19DRAFT_1907629 [Suillus lakei]
MSSFISIPPDDYPPPLREEPTHPEHTQDPEETHLTGVQQVIITGMLCQSPFHVVVEADGAECQTSNTPVHEDQTVVEWNERTLLSHEHSKVQVSVYTSLELGPMLCHGELLRTFEISVGELLDRSENSHPTTFQPQQEEVMSLRTSLLMTVEPQHSDENDATVLCPLTTLTSGDGDALMFRMDAGHSLFAQYHWTQNSRDLNQSIKHFTRASDLCPMDHPYHPAALFNQATAKFVVKLMTHLNLDIPITLFKMFLICIPLVILTDPSPSSILPLLCCPASRNGNFNGC